MKPTPPRRPLFDGKVANQSDPKLKDQVIDRHNLEIREAVTQLRDLPANNLRVIQNVTLEDGKVTPVAHKLGRVPAIVLVSSPRGLVASSGRIVESKTAYDPAVYATLTATGYGVTVTVDLLVL